MSIREKLPLIKKIRRNYALLVLEDYEKRQESIQIDKQNNFFILSCQKVWFGEKVEIKSCRPWTKFDKFIGQMAKECNKIKKEQSLGLDHVINLIGAKELQEEHEKYLRLCLRTD